MTRSFVLAFALLGCGSAPDPFNGTGEQADNGTIAMGGTSGAAAASSGGVTTLAVASGGAGQGGSGGAAVATGGAPASKTAAYTVCRFPQSSVGSPIELDCSKECADIAGRVCSATGCGADTGLVYLRDGEDWSQCIAGHGVLAAPMYKTTGCGAVTLPGAPDQGYVTRCCCETP